MLLPYVYDDKKGNILSLLDAVNNDELLKYIRNKYISFYSGNTNPVALLMDTLIASDESHFASLSSKQPRISWKSSADISQHYHVTPIQHVVFGSSPFPGGQWTSPSLMTSYTNYNDTQDFSSSYVTRNANNSTEKEVETSSDDEKSLSYAEMLSLPGYSFSEFCTSNQNHDIPDFSRPQRHDIANYYSQYPSQLHLDDSFYSNTIVVNVDNNLDNTENGNRNFVVKYAYLDDPLTYHEIKTSIVVLASGVFEKPLKHFLESIHKISTPPSLSDSIILNNDSDESIDLKQKADDKTKDTTDFQKSFRATFQTDYTKIISETESRDEIEANINSKEPSILIPSCPPQNSPPTVLIIGSGVSAAEAVNKLSKRFNIIHIFRWDDPENKSPLKRLSGGAYPEYSHVFKLMKKAVKLQNKTLQKRLDGIHDKSTQSIELDKSQIEPMNIINNTHSYLGLHDARIEYITPCGKVIIKITYPSRCEPGNLPYTICMSVAASKIKICTGRSGSLEYLSDSVRKLAGLRSVNADLGSVSKTFLSNISSNMQEQQIIEKEDLENVSETDSNDDYIKTNEITGEKYSIHAYPTHLDHTDKQSETCEFLEDTCSLSSEDLEKCLCSSSVPSSHQGAMYISSPEKINSQNGLCSSSSSLNTSPENSLSNHSISEKKIQYNSVKPDSLLTETPPATLNTTGISQPLTRLTKKNTTSIARSLEDSYNSNLGQNLYAIGSLTGETLVRFMLGGCVWVAKEIFQQHSRNLDRI